MTENKRKFSPEDELRYKNITHARLSPDGKQVVYALNQNDLEKDTISTQLWLIEIASGEAVPLTHGDKQNTLPEWSPDGSQIAFLSDRSGKTQIYLLPVQGGEARQITHLKQGVASGPAWSPDGKTIAFTAAAEEEPPDPTKPYRITRTIYRFDGVGYLHWAVQNIHLVNLESEETRQLTNDLHIDQNLNWSPDGKEILYLANWDPERANLFSSKIRVVNLEGKIDEIVGLDWGWINDARWSTTGDQIVFGGILAGKRMGAKTDLWTIARSGGQPECRTGTIPYGSCYGFGAYHLADEQTAFATVQREGMDEICCIAMTGAESCQAVIQGQRSAQLLDVRAQRILFRNSTIANPGELHIADLDGKNEKTLTCLNETWLEEIALPGMQRLLFKNDEGVQIEGWVLNPPDVEPPYPTLLYIHGGPHGAYGYAFRSDFQMLAGAGFAVLFINPRGSSSYGDAFSTALSGHWGVLDYKDLMAGVDCAIDQGIADPQRLGVCGLSYGGYMTCFIVGQTGRFKAAVAENPITDLVSRYGTADMGPWGSLGELGGKPHEIPDVYSRSSPITYAHKCTTPTLLIQGEADYRCPAGQSEQFYTTLKANGCIAEMLRLPGMPHVGSISGPLTVRKAQNTALLEWMHKYVR